MTDKVVSNDRKTTLVSSDKGRILFDFWPLPRPMTKGWGSGDVFKRLTEMFGMPRVAFGKTDGIPEAVPYYDINNGYDWAKLPVEDNFYLLGYWDPPYDKLYKKEAKEIWRVCQKLAILHTHVYPTSWFEGAVRIAMIAVTMGPLKQIRILQVFEKTQQNKE